ncbi:hypothetical protein LPTSP3_g15680 [Leptospira kobayashii]|uniref:Transmembrane family 220, helix n=1 Tax=Leptospira kobayashii TaxID=1917830 RepID=A0ABN6KCI7_9LEPT|nr:transmembrane 220 family protein [Leptospira kobayashii]BDA78638.1 hypothetical protein LPTSP3_g15680 [Leptospira kobayashii]
MSILFKIINVVFALLFFTSAALQYNDPDPIHWIFIYGLAAILCSLAVAGKFYLPLIYILFGAVLLQLLILSDGAFQWYLQGSENMLSTPMSKDKPYIEEIREFFGALIVLGSNLFLLYRANKGKGKQS